jgi:predicted nucleotidyltransferase
MTTQFEINRDQIAAFCEKWQITEFAIFGSMLRDDFGPNSDVDVLVTFEEGAPWSLWELFTMQDELRGIFGRAVDLVEKDAIKNPFRRHHILSNCEVIHAA